jgi:hypothetical protein
MTLLRSSSGNRPAHCHRALGILTAPRMVELLTARISSGTRKRKIFATWAVGNAEISDPTIVQAITRNLDAPQDALRHASFLALARIVERPTVEFVRRIEEELRRSLVESRPPPAISCSRRLFCGPPSFCRCFGFLRNRRPDHIRDCHVCHRLDGRHHGGSEPAHSGATGRNLAGSERLRCMNTVALLFKAPELSQETLMALRREFEAKSSDFSCRPEVFSLHPFDARRDTLNITRINIQGFRYLATSSELYRERICACWPGCAMIR